MVSLIPLPLALPGMREFSIHTVWGLNHKFFYTMMKEMKFPRWVYASTHNYWRMRLKAKVRRSRQLNRDMNETLEDNYPEHATAYEGNDD